MFDVTDHPENQRSAILLDLYQRAGVRQQGGHDHGEDIVHPRYPPGCSRKSQG